MIASLLVDTDVLIDFLRDQPGAVAYLKSRSERLLISAVTVAELYTGVRDGRETTDLEAMLSLFVVAPIDRDTAAMAGGFRRAYRKSHNLATSPTPRGSDGEWSCPGGRPTGRRSRKGIGRSTATPRYRSSITTCRASRTHLKDSWICTKTVVGIGGCRPYD